MKLIRSFAYAWQGIKLCLQERNFRIHLASGFVVIALGLLFSISNMEWIAVILCIAIVLVSEMFNTAIEHLCNVLHSEIHPGIKRVKDIAAGAVLVAACISMVTGMVIFLPKFISYF